MICKVPSSYDTHKPVQKVNSVDMQNFKLVVHTQKFMKLKVIKYNGKLIESTFTKHLHIENHKYIQQFFYI